MNRKELRETRDHMLDFEIESNPDELMKKNQDFKKDREAGKEFTQESLEKSDIKDVTVLYTDLSGVRRHLTYPKAHFLGSSESLTSDGSSIDGFNLLEESDSLFRIDWSSIRILPEALRGKNQALLFANLTDENGNEHPCDMRSKLINLVKEQSKKNIRILVAPEIEGFVFAGTYAEQEFDQRHGFTPIDKAGYFGGLGNDPLSLYIKHLTQILEVLGYSIEKAHKEVAPSQFEINYKYTDAHIAAEQIVVKQWVAQMLAHEFGLTASYLPKPTANLNGSGMHTNISLQQDGKNLFYGDKAFKLSEKGHHFAAGILNRAHETAITYAGSHNAFRRFDPNFEAPNEIKMSGKDRGSVIRVPMLGKNKKAARVEFRAMGTDVNPFLAYYIALSAGLTGIEKQETIPEKTSKVPKDIQDGLMVAKESEFLMEKMGETALKNYLELKEEHADRVPRKYTTRVNNNEVHYHPHVINQELESQY